MTNRLKTVWRGYDSPRILEDNSPVHLAHVNRAAGRALHFKYLDHPPSSPGLNPIENNWAYLKRELDRLERHPTSKEELATKAQRIWMAIPQRVMDNGVDSLPRRMKGVIRSQGFPINY